MTRGCVGCERPRNDWTIADGHIVRLIELETISPRFGWTEFCWQTPRGVEHLVPLHAVPYEFHRAGRVESPLFGLTESAVPDPRVVAATRHASDLEELHQLAVHCRRTGIEHPMLAKLARVHHLVGVGVGVHRHRRSAGVDDPNGEHTGGTRVDGLPGRDVDRAGVERGNV